MYEKITSTEQVLNTCKDLLMNEGFDSINMRRISEACHISLGSLYNYFDSKGSLIYQLTLNVFDDIFKLDNVEKEKIDTISIDDIFKLDNVEKEKIDTISKAIKWLHDSFVNGDKKYKHFISTHSSIFSDKDKTDGRKMMDKFLLHVQEVLLNILEKDKKVLPNKFTSQKNKEKFVEYLVRILKISLVERVDDIDDICYFVDQYLYN